MKIDNEEICEHGLTEKDIEIARWSMIEILNFLGPILAQAADKEECLEAIRTIVQGFEGAQTGAYRMCASIAHHAAEKITQGALSLKDIQGLLENTNGN